MSQCEHGRLLIFSHIQKILIHSNWSRVKTVHHGLSSQLYLRRSYWMSYGHVS